MSNPYFQFKQFRVDQHNAAMKVTTDACLFGAWVARQAALMPHLNNCLDIGTGTGLLSLMIAQQSPAAIDAVEIEENAFIQAKQNFANSLWRDRLRVHHTGISDFNQGNKYDLIICNPPFHENELRSPSATINLARHDQGLTFELLVKEVDRLLSSAGLFAVLLPYYRVEEFIRIASLANLYLQNKLLVKQTEKHDFFRGVLVFGRVPSELISEEIIIKIGDQYSHEFSELLKEYYL